MYSQSIERLKNLNNSRSIFYDSSQDVVAQQTLLPPTITNRYVGNVATMMQSGQAAQPAFYQQRKSNIEGLQAATTMAAMGYRSTFLTYALSFFTNFNDLVDLIDFTQNKNMIILFHSIVIFIALFFIIPSSIYVLMRHNKKVWIRTGFASIIEFIGLIIAIATAVFSVIRLNKLEEKTFMDTIVVIGRFLKIGLFLMTFTYAINNLRRKSPWIAVNLYVTIIIAILRIIFSARSIVANL